jgi:hypothetical protein
VILYFYGTIGEELKKCVSENFVKYSFSTLIRVKLHRRNVKPNNGFFCLIAEVISETEEGRVDLSASQEFPHTAEGRTDLHQVPGTVMETALSWPVH